MVERVVRNGYLRRNETKSHLFGLFGCEGEEIDRGNSRVLRFFLLFFFSFSRFSFLSRFFFSQVGFHPQVVLNSAVVFRS